MSSSTKVSIPCKVKTKKTPKIPKFFRDIADFYKEQNYLYPCSNSPICARCVINNCGCKTPYIQYAGSEHPVVTFVIESVSQKEDSVGEPLTTGTSSLIKKLVIQILAKENLDFGISDIRFVFLTRCFPANKKKPKVGGTWCKHFLVQDFKEHRPSLIIPVGSASLGHLCHKSSAPDWEGKLLTYRGWPDDWLVDKKFENGHPIFGNRPTQDDYIPMVPIQNPSMVFATQNNIVINRWRENIATALKLANTGVTPKTYNKPWWSITYNKQDVINCLNKLIENPGTIVTYDTETTGLKPWLGQKIVTMMVRFNDPITGKPIALGWPWEYEKSELLQDIKELSPYVLKALSVSKLRGHNLSFDILFTVETVPGGHKYLNQLCEAFYQDTWHMIYTLRQLKGSLGLELVTYDWAPELAGYEEEMTLLIDRYEDILNPEYGGHYANCPKELWQSHYRPYIMGDVETCNIIADNVQKTLQNSPVFEIPIANPNKLGKYRLYKPINRWTLYNNFLNRAGSVLCKMMARGFYVDQTELGRQEIMFPTLINESKHKFIQEDEKLKAWHDDIETMYKNENPDSTWELDLENRKILKTLLFDILKMPVTCLTEAGIKKYGEDIRKVPYDKLVEFASTDKFTLNGLAVEHPIIRHLLSYRKLYKEYTSFIRPMRNIKVEGLDKKERTKTQLLMNDGCVHGSFIIPGTRTGRLSCREPNLQQLSKDGFIKRIYTSRFKDGCLYNADLSQIELRLLAAACGDPTMVGAYINKKDLHSITCSKIFKIPYENFSDEYTKWLQEHGKDKEIHELSVNRRVAKTCNFLTGYGGGSLGLQSSLANAGVYLPIEECDKLLNSFFDTYPFLKKHIGIYKRFIAQNGLAVSLTGRVRILEEVHSEDNKQVNKALRAGYNHLIQSTASDMMLCCLIAIESIMRDEGLESMLVSTVHDSLTIDAKINELDKIHNIVTEILNNIPEVLQAIMGDEFDSSFCIVPLTGDCEVGLNYLDMRKIIDDKPDWEKLLSAKS